MSRPRVLLVGAGARVYREYLLAGLARDHDVWLLSEQAPDWAQPYLIGHSRVNTADPAEMIALATGLAVEGVLTWEDPRVVQTAQLAQALGLPGCSPQAALRCRDKHATRTALAAAGVPQAASTLVQTLAQARAAAEAIGFPVVLKARALAASIGVVKVDRPDQLATRFRIARGASAPGLTELAPGDVLVEQYLDGPEISVDAAWYGGDMSLAFIARKQLGYPPYFEEVGHLVDAGDPLLADQQLRAVLVAAHAAVGFEAGWSHTELRLTPNGPKVVEINPRIGGDRIPQLAELATGLQAGPAAAALACGRAPELVTGLAAGPAIGSAAVAGIRFCYPEHDVLVREVRIDRDRLPATVVCAQQIAVGGQELRLPPAGHVSSRYAFVMVVAGTLADCEADLAAARAAISLEVLGPR